MSPNVHILICGLGSIGRRHLANLMTLGYQNITLVARSGKVPQEFQQFTVYKNLADALQAQDITHAFICTPTAQHVVDVQVLAQFRVPNVYLEKPVSHNLEGVLALRDYAQSCQRFVVGFDLHFDPGLSKMKQWLDSGSLGKIFSINAVVGQYLPDWRPHEDHRQGMSAQIEKGGGVMLDLVHEFDYVRWLAGRPSHVACVLQHNPKLEIETEDVADVLLRFPPNQSASIHLDYHQKTLVRHCLITCENGSLFWDLAKWELRITRHGFETEIFSYAGYERNQRYLDIASAFMDAANYDTRLTSFDEALTSLEMVVAAKTASNTNQIITLP